MKKIHITIAFLSFLVSATYSQWTTQNIGYSSTPVLIFDLEVVDTNVVWAVPSDLTASGININEVAKTVDGGSTWRWMKVGTDSNSKCINVCALDSSTAWVTKYSTDTANMGVFKTTDGGSTWVRQGGGAMFSGMGSWPAFVYFKDANNGVAVGDPESGYFEIWTTTDGGTNWTRVPSGNIPAPAGDYSLTNSFCVSGDTLWFGSYKAKMYRSVDFGQNWTVATVSTLANTEASDVYFINHQVGLARTLTNGITARLHRSTDGGLTWNNVLPTGSWMRSDLDGIPGTSIFISTGSGCSYSADDGSTWVTMYSTPLLQGATGWANSMTGWVGSQADDSVTGGIEKFSSSVGVGITPKSATDASIRIFPNPTSSDFTVQLEGSACLGDAILEINDICGKNIYRNVISSSGGLIEIPVHLGNVPKGVYILNVISGSLRFSQKLIIE